MTPQKSIHQVNLGPFIHIESAPLPRVVCSIHAFPPWNPKRRELRMTGFRSGQEIPRVAPEEIGGRQQGLTSQQVMRLEIRQAIAVETWERSAVGQISGEIHVKTHHFPRKERT